jgi:hypothetical protein
MNNRMVNFLNSIAPLTQSEADLGELLIISYVESAWAQDKNIQVNDVLHGVKNFSSASLNRKLRKLREKKILSFELSPTDERVKFIKKGFYYSDYLDQIDFMAPNNHAQLR